MMRPTDGTGAGAADTGPAIGELPRAVPVMAVTSYVVPSTSPSTTQVAGSPDGRCRRRKAHAATSPTSHQQPDDQRRREDHQ